MFFKHFIKKTFRKSKEAIKEKRNVYFSNIFGEYIISRVVSLTKIPNASEFGKKKNK